MTPITSTPTDTWKIFDQISSKYDILNTILSLGTHDRWRKKLCRFFPKTNNIKILDLATGTADVLLTAIKLNPNITTAFGIDLSEKMLAVGNEKITNRKLNNKITLSKDDAQNISFDANIFDCTTIAFGIRNTENPSLVLKEMYRVLNENGRALILEFSLPKNKIFCSIYLFYLRNILPSIGHLLSGNSHAYKYLNQSIEAFPCGEDFCHLMRNASFTNVKYHTLSGGIATIYQGNKISSKK